MADNTCERCQKVFSTKSKFNSHMNRKKPCDKFGIQKPFLKWVGGKTQIIDKVIERFPSEINNYHEPFLGGGSVLLALLSLQKQNKINIIGGVFASDANKLLINVFKAVQSNKGELFDYITKYITEYDSITGTEINKKPKTIEEAKTSKESYYYWMRKQFNECDSESIECSALFMVINKTCFRGMYRASSNGFNVPYGHYKNTPTIITQSDLDIISDLIKDVVFTHCDFAESIANSQEGDFIYLDPPYAPKNSTSFVGYNASGFGISAHEKLFEMTKSLNEKKIKFVMSNAKVELVIKNFATYDMEEIIARRAINAKKPESTAVEVLIHN